jgi:hypothetical protein
MEFSLHSLTSASPVSEFTNNLATTVGGFVAGLQRINARRAHERAGSVQATSAMHSGAGRCESSIPSLAAGFGYAAWRS